MPLTSREIVTRCLTFDTPERMPRELWVLPWATIHYPDALAELARRFPSAFSSPPVVYRPSPRRAGDMYAVGSSTDDWGCTFVNIQAGAIGEVREE